jgi:hypothetical protein
MAGDIKLQYGTPADLTITLASLTTSASLVAGRESTAIDNRTDEYLDALVSGYVTAGTGLTAGILEVWVYGQIDDTPTYPEVLTGSDGGRTFTTRDQMFAGMRLGARIVTNATNSVVYPIAPFSVASLFGGVMPRRWGVFVTHSMVGALASSGHKIQYAPVHQQYT